MVKFKLRIYNGVHDTENSLDSYVPLTKLRKAAVFKLKLTPEHADEAYNVFIRAERKADLFLGDVIKRFESYFNEGHSSYPARFRDSRQRGALAPTASIAPSARMINGNDIVKFPNEQAAVSVELNEPKTEVETFSETEVHENTNDYNHTATDAIAAYGTSRGTSMNVLQRCGTKIEMNAQSQVLVAPGMMGQLIFDVTNTRSEAVYQNVQVTDERRYLLRLTPQSLYLRPYQTATVSVTVMVPAGTAQGTTDRITFTCHGGETASLSLNLKVITSIDAQDTTAPSLNWEFGNRCDNIAADAINCAERFWTLDITAQDWQSGILRLQTTPSDGLFYRNSYTIGSTEPMKATYMATCCEPKVSLLAHDAAGNQRAYNIDVRDIWLNDAAIAAIALGALLLILLIALLVASIVWCCRRRKVSLELPTYRSHSSRSME